MQRIYFILIISLFSTLLPAQQSTDTLFNQTDKQGKKQGYWKVKYDNGAIKYTANFINDKPIGEMRRYFDDNSLKAIIIFNKSGIKSYAKLYYQSGPIAAEGIYINSVKDSTWKYYSFYTKALTCTETYSMGKRNGKTINFFTSGKISEEINWKNDVRDGMWKQNYENGTVKMYSYFSNDKRTGPFIFNYPNGTPEWTGKYEEGLMEGKWVHYSDTGKIDNTIEYTKGKAPNEEELRQKESDLLKQLELKKGKIPEPDESNMNPGR